MSEALHPYGINPIPATPAAAPEAQGLGAGPWEESLERQRQQLQLDYFAMKQRAESVETELELLQEAVQNGLKLVAYWQQQYNQQAARLATLEAERAAGAANTARLAEVERTRLAEVEAQEEVTRQELRKQPFYGCWWNSACPCNPTNPNECPLHLCDEATPVAPAPQQQAEAEGGGRG